MSHSRKVRFFVVGSLMSAIVAMLLMSAWLLWPEWQAYQERTAFEQLARQLRAGLDPRDDGLRRVLPNGYSNVTWRSFQMNGSDTHTAFAPYYLKYGWYCVYFKYDADGRTELVQIYRVEKPPKGYKAQTKTGRQVVTPPPGTTRSRGTPTGVITEPVPPLAGDEATREGYLWDFYEVVSGQVSSDLGIRHELVHSDPAPARK